MIDPNVLQNLTDKLEAVKARETDLDAASSANDAAQTAAQAAIATAAGTATARASAHDALVTAINDLEAALEALKA